jgi:hypothetical protein
VIAVAVGVVELETPDVLCSLPGVYADMKIMEDTFDDFGFLLLTILIDGTPPQIPSQAQGLSCILH